MSDEIVENEEHDEEHGLAHVLPWQLLVGVWVALMLLTGLTVEAATIHISRTINMIIAMGIATVKALLVAGIFMHLHYDRKFHAIVFFSSLLFAFVFIAFVMIDVVEYMPDIELFIDR